MTSPPPKPKTRPLIENARQRSHWQRITLLLVLGVACAAGIRTLAVVAQSRGVANQATPAKAGGASTRTTQVSRGLPDFDIRAGQQRSQSLMDRENFIPGPQVESRVSIERRVLERERATSRLLRERPDARFRWSSLTSRPSRIVALGRPLTEPTRGDASQLARRFLVDNADTFGLERAEVDGLRVERRFRTQHNGLTHVVLQQTTEELDVFQAQMAIHLDRRGAVIGSNGELYPNLASERHPTEPLLDSSNALHRASQFANATTSSPPIPLAAARGASRAQRFGRSAGFSRDIDARLVFFPLGSTQLRLAWELFLWLEDSPDAYLILVDAENGTLLFRYNMTCYDENPLRPHGLVFTSENPRPHNPYTGVDSPPVVAQQDVPLRAEPFNGHTIFTVSDRHYDWWAGAPANGLVSNNTDTHLDRDSEQNQPDTPRLGAPDGNFSFVADFAVAPTTETTQKASQVNLFYWMNRYHDILYSFGFDEAAGNFQTNNFNLGGFGGDAIQADAQDGSGTNNANFSTPPDGQSGRVQMFLWTAFNPQLDGDFDQGVIIHEATHGLTNRLVGNATGLLGMQSRGMGEGWSDYFALVLLRTANDDQDGRYGVGQYLTNNYSRGIRRFPYTTSLTHNPLTFAAVLQNTEVHAIGEIWCSVLWEMRRLLVGRYGFAEGQRQSIQLVVDGLKLTPTAPSFLDARDAILLADRVNNNGANQCLLWRAFAKRGLGFNASTVDASDTAPLDGFAEAPFCSNSATIALDRKNYLPGESASITLGDANAPANSTVAVRSTITGDVETIVLTADLNTPGSFQATMPIVTGKANPGDRILQGSTQLLDRILVTYQDAVKADGTSGAVSIDAGFAREDNLFNDNVEGGNLSWMTSGTWAMLGTLSASPSRSWIVRSSGNDVYIPAIALTSRLLDLSLLTDITVSFAQNHDLFSGLNYGAVDYSVDDGVTWARARTFTGTRTTFNQAAVRLRGLDGQNRARFRFVLLNSIPLSTNYWAIDDIVLFGRSADPSIIPPETSNAPRLESIVPASGAAAGGTLVTITGLNFTESEDTSVTFDGIPASETTVIGASRLTARTPAHALGPVTVGISTRLGATARAGAFTYYQIGSPAPAPTLATIWPSRGSVRGGLVVTLFGNGFTPASTVVIGPASAQTTFVDQYTLRAIVPQSLTTGAVSVRVSNGAQQTTLDNGFTYTAPTPPSVEILSPSGGETIFAGSTTRVGWRSSDNTTLSRHRIFIRYLSGQFVVQNEIATDLSGGAQSFNWQIPITHPATSEARIYVIATDDERVDSLEVASSPFSVSPRWQRITQLPSALLRVQSASDGQSVFVLGGRANSNLSSTTTAVIRYDPQTNDWTQGLAPMPLGLNSGEAALINGRIYIPGGLSTAGVSGSHSAYDIAQNTWLQRTNPPTPVYLYSVVADPIAGVFYQTGGSNTSNAAVSLVRAYNTTLDSWSEMPPMSVARFAHESVLIESKLYVAGGSGATGGLTSCEVFDFSTQRWSPVASLNTPRLGAASFVTSDPAGNPLWLLVGGRNPTNGFSLGAEGYDVRNNRWIQLDHSYSLTAARAYIGSVTLGGFAYALGGGNPTTGISTNERLQITSLNPVSANRAPVLTVPESVVGVPGDELKVSIQAGDLAATAPISVTATDLPPGASFSTTAVTNNSVTGLLKWTPSNADRGKVFVVSFIVSDGELGETRKSILRVVDAAALAAVRAADFKADAPVAPDSLVAAFGADLAIRTDLASTIPLPFDLAGTTVSVNGHEAQLLFVSKLQVNFVIPSGVEPGPATIVVRSATGTYSATRIQVTSAAPALFTVNQNGTGDAAAVATPDGVNYQSPPFDVTVGGRPNILLLFGTGFRHAQAGNPGDDNGVAESVVATIDGRPTQVLYAGAQGAFIGLDQLNLEMPAGLAGGPRRVEIVITVNGISVNLVTVEIR